MAGADRRGGGDHRRRGDQAHPRVGDPPGLSELARLAGSARDALPLGPRREHGALPVRCPDLRWQRHRLRQPRIAQCRRGLDDVGNGHEPPGPEILRQCRNDGRRCRQFSHVAVCRAGQIHERLARQLQLCPAAPPACRPVDRARALDDRRARAPGEPADAPVLSAGLLPPGRLRGRHAAAAPTPRRLLRRHRLHRVHRHGRRWFRQHRRRVLRRQRCRPPGRRRGHRRRGVCRRWCRQRRRLLRPSPGPPADPQRRAESLRPGTGPGPPRCQPRSGPRRPRPGRPAPPERRNQPGGAPPGEDVAHQPDRGLQGQRPLPSLRHGGGPRRVVHQAVPVHQPRTPEAPERFRRLPRHLVVRR